MADEMIPYNGSAIREQIQYENVEEVAPYERGNSLPQTNIIIEMDRDSFSGAFQNADLSGVIELPTIMPNMNSVTSGGVIDYTDILTESRDHLADISKNADLSKTIPKEKDDEKEKKDGKKGTGKNDTEGMLKHFLGWMVANDNKFISSMGKIFTGLEKILENSISYMKDKFWEVLKPISAITDPLKAIFKDVFNIGKKGSPEEETSENTSQSAIILDDMFTWMRVNEEEKAKFLKYYNKKEEDKPWWKKVLPVVATLIGMAVGMFYQFIVAKFKILGAVLSPLVKGFRWLGIKILPSIVKGFKWLTGILESSGSFGKAIVGFFKTVGSKMGGILGVVGNFADDTVKMFKSIPTIFSELVTGVRGMFAGVLKFLRGGGSIGKSVASFMSKIFGFFNSIAGLGKYFSMGIKMGKSIPFVGQFIQIIVSVFDFFKGFVDTEGNLLDKIMGGFRQVVLGFVELPAKIIGWVVEKTLGLFGVQVEGVGQSIIDIVMGFTDFLISGIRGWFGLIGDIFMANPIVSFITGFFSTEGDLMTKLKGGFDEMIKNVIELPEKVWEHIQSMLPTWLGGKKADSGSNRIGDPVTRGQASSGNFAGSRSFAPTSSGSSLPSVTNIAPKTGSMLGITKKDNSVDFSGINPAMGQNFFGMAAEYNQLTGKTIQVNSAYRSPEEQAKLWDGGRNPNAAPPGRSLHEKGFALDINSSNANELQSLGLFDKYGFTRPMAHETWHIEPKSIQGNRKSLTGGIATTEKAGGMSGSLISKQDPLSPTGTSSSGMFSKIVEKSFSFGSGGGSITPSIVPVTTSSGSVSPYTAPSMASAISPSVASGGGITPQPIKNDISAPDISQTKANIMQSQVTADKNINASVDNVASTIKKGAITKEDIGAGVSGAIASSGGSSTTKEREIPMDIENLSILLYNKSWGMG